jgi:hypothetical protein
LHDGMDSRGVFAIIIFDGWGVEETAISDANN